MHENISLIELFFFLVLILIANVVRKNNIEWKKLTFILFKISIVTD